MLPEVLVLVIAMPLLWLVVLTWMLASLTVRLRDIARREDLSHLQGQLHSKVSREDLHHLQAQLHDKASRKDMQELQAEMSRVEGGIERLNERTAHLVDRLDSIHDILMKRP